MNNVETRLKQLVFILSHLGLRPANDNWKTTNGVRGFSYVDYRGKVFFISFRDSVKLARYTATKYTTEGKRHIYGNDIFVNADGSRLIHLYSGGKKHIFFVNADIVGKVHNLIQSSWGFSCDDLQYRKRKNRLGCSGHDSTPYVFSSHSGYSHNTIFFVKG